MHEAAGSTLSELPRVRQSSVLHGQLLQRPLRVRTPALNLLLDRHSAAPTGFPFAALLQLGSQC